MSKRKSPFPDDEPPAKTPFRRLFTDAEHPVDKADDAHFVAAWRFPNLWERSKVLEGEVTEGGSLFGSFYKGPELLFTNELERLDSGFGEESSLFSIPGDFAWAVPRVEVESLEETETETSTTVTRSGEVGGEKEVEVESDCWVDGETWELARPARFYTWDSFARDEAKNQQTCYLTEAGSNAFDAVLARWKGPEAGDVFRSDVFCTCVRYLGMGISSILFEYDEKDRKFKQRRKGIRLSGLTVETTESFVQLFAKTGDQIRELLRFINMVYHSANVGRSTLLALANCANSVISALRYRLSTVPASSLNSILALQALIQTPALILSTFLDLIRQLRNTADETDLLGKLFDILQEHEHKGGWIREFLLHIFRRVSKPWLEFVEEWLGFREERDVLVGVEMKKKERYFIGVEEEMVRIEGDGKAVQTLGDYYVLKRESIPTFLSWEDAVVLFETGKSLRYLQNCKPDHPLSHPGMGGKIKLPGLDWKFGWEELDNLHAQAKSYEKALLDAINTYMEPKSSSRASFRSGDVSMMDVDDEGFQAETPTTEHSRTAEEIEAEALVSLQAIITTTGSSPPSLPPKTDALHNYILEICENENPTDDSSTFAPPLSITPMLSFSHLIFAQHRLLNAVCLRLFFTEHHLQMHFNILRRFFLFGDGIYTSRLSHALFDSDTDSTERHKGMTGKVLSNLGLKLGSRSTWPPASYEVRLALMNVLTDSYASNTSSSSTDLPGGLSFAIRELEEEELQKCTNPHRIFALDFLKLDYRPPNPLNAVITSLSLSRYDRIFRLLLRILRMQHIASTLFTHTLSTPPSHSPLSSGPHHRPSQTTILKTQLQTLKLRYRHEASHFIRTLSSYLSTTALHPITTFTTHLTTLSASLSTPTISPREEGLHALRSLHESSLDQILTSSFLKRRQAPVMTLLEDIFDLILEFAATYSPSEVEGQEVFAFGLDEEGVRERYRRECEAVERGWRQFRRKVRVFGTVVRGMAAEGGKGGEGLARLVGEVEGGMKR